MRIIEIEIEIEEITQPFFPKIMSISHRRSSLLGSALRVFLVSSLEDARAQLSCLEAEAIIFTICGEVDSKWKTVLSTAQQIIQYIKNCQADDEQNIFLTTGITGLAALDRLQTSLSFQCTAAREKRDPEIEGLATRKAAHYSINALIAERAGDKELAGFWIAVTNICESNAQDPIFARQLSYLESPLSYKKEELSLRSGNALDKEARLMYLQADKLCLKLHAMNLIKSLDPYGSKTEMLTTRTKEIEAAIAVCVKMAEQLCRASKLLSDDSEDLSVLFIFTARIAISALRWIDITNRCGSVFDCLLKIYLSGRFDPKGETFHFRIGFQEQEMVLPPRSRQQRQLSLLQRH